MGPLGYEPNTLASTVSCKYTEDVPAPPYAKREI